MPIRVELLLYRVLLPKLIVELGLVRTTIISFMLFKKNRKMIFIIKKMNKMIMSNKRKMRRRWQRRNKCST